MIFLIVKLYVYLGCPIFRNIYLEKNVEISDIQIKSRDLERQLWELSLALLSQEDIIKLG